MMTRDDKYDQGDLSQKLLPEMKNIVIEVKKTQ